MNDTTVCKNVRTVNANIMQSGTHTWNALVYPNRLETEGSGFYFRIHFYKEDTPDGIVWMTLTMKRILLQYEDIHFIDAQKQKYNKM